MGLGYLRRCLVECAIACEEVIRLSDLVGEIAERDGGRLAALADEVLSGEDFRALLVADAFDPPEDSGFPNSPRNLAENPYSLQVKHEVGQNPTSSEDEGVRVCSVSVRPS